MLSIKSQRGKQGFTQRNNRETVGNSLHDGSTTMLHYGECVLRAKKFYFGLIRLENFFQRLLSLQYVFSQTPNRISYSLLYHKARLCGFSGLWLFCEQLLPSRFLQILQSSLYSLINTLLTWVLTLGSLFFKGKQSPWEQENTLQYYVVELLRVPRREPNEELCSFIFSLRV